MNNFRKVTVKYIGEQQLWVYVALYNLGLRPKVKSDYLWADDKNKPTKLSIVDDAIAIRIIQHGFKMSYLDMVLNFFKLHTLKVY